MTINIEELIKRLRSDMTCTTHKQAADALESLQTELSRKDSALGTISHALKHAEHDCAMYRCRAGELENENRRLKLDLEDFKTRCAEAYQLAGVVGAPQRFLDALGDAANGEIGKRFVGDLLPVAAQECDEIAKLQRELEAQQKYVLELERSLGNAKRELEEARNLQAIVLDHCADLDQCAVELRQYESFQATAAEVEKASSELRDAARQQKG